MQSTKKLNTNFGIKVFHQLWNLDEKQSKISANKASKNLSVKIFTNTSHLKKYLENFQKCFLFAVKL